MAMARTIEAPPPRRRHPKWPVVTLLLVLAATLTAIFVISRLQSHKTANTHTPTQSTYDSLLANPNAICYTHNPNYKPPKLIRNQYSAVFNDENDIQLESAQRNGIEDLAKRGANYEKYGLVPLRENRYYTVSELKYSVPYLVPEARVMLNTIGKCFQDVLAEKYPNSKYKIVVTSVLRTNEDVEKLVRRNRWATENSCHKHGTTVDISYHKYVKMSGPDVTDYEMKEFLAKALAELRDAGLCYVKYERRNCFHITLNQMNVDGVTVDNSNKADDKETDIISKKDAKPTKTYKNKDAERLHQRDEELRQSKTEKTKRGKKKYQSPSPMI